MSNRSAFICINDNIISHRAQRGVARYFNKVLDGVIASFGDKAIVCSPEARDYGAARHIRTLRFSDGNILKIQEIIAALASYAGRTAVFYSPYYGNAKASGAKLFTVYDMIHELMPQHFMNQAAYWRRFVAEKKRCLARASALLAISESTAADIVTCYPSIDAARIITTPLGVDDFFFQACDQPTSTAGKPFFLYVGQRSHYKNFLRLLIAFGQSGLSSEFELRIISPSGADFDPQEIEIIDRYRLRASVRLVTNVSEVDLRENYAKAVAFVYPSEYEGFGLPILEAMASGTLVATSNVSSMPEVGGEAAFYFEPRRVESIAACLQYIVALSAEQRRLAIMRGNARAKAFTWARCQQQTVEAFQRFV